MLIFIYLNKKWKKKKSPNTSVAWFLFFLLNILNREWRYNFGHLSLLLDLHKLSILYSIHMKWFFCSWIVLQNIKKIVSKYEWKLWNFIRTQPFFVCFHFCTSRCLLCIDFYYYTVHLSSTLQYLCMSFFFLRFVKLLGRRTDLWRFIYESRYQWQHFVIFFFSLYMNLCTLHTQSRDMLFNSLVSFWFVYLNIYLHVCNASALFFVTSRQVQ